MGLKLLEIEHELYGSNAEEALAKYDSTLKALDDRITEALTGGLERDEYAKVSRLKESNLTARKLLRLAVKEGVVASSESQDVNKKQQ